MRLVSVQWSVCRDRCPHHMSVALSVLIPPSQPLSKGKNENQARRDLRWHTGSKTDLINCETHRDVMQLWGRGDYCLPMMLIINLITLHVERDRGRSRNIKMQMLDQCVSEAAFRGKGSQLPLLKPRRASLCHLGLTSHSPAPCHNLFADPK